MAAEAKVPSMAAEATVPIVTKITEEQLAMLKSTTTAGEWKAACVAIKNAHPYGGYPSDWSARVHASGLFDKQAQNWASGAGKK